MTSSLKLFVIVGLFSSISILFPSSYALECIEKNQTDFEMVLDCVDTIDVNKEKMELMYDDVNQFSSTFDGATVTDIRTEGNSTFATLTVPIPVVNDLKSQVKITKYQNYLLEFVEGDLQGSSLAISFSKTNGYDGTKDAGTKVNFDLKIKQIPCFAFGLKCGTVQDFEFILDRGLHLIEQEATKVTDSSPEISKTNSINEDSKIKQETKPTNQIANTNSTEYDDNLYVYSFDNCGLNDANPGSNHNYIGCHGISSDQNQESQFPKYWLEVSTKWYLAGLITEAEFNNGIKYFLSSQNS